MRVFLAACLMRLARSDSEFGSGKLDWRAFGIVLLAHLLAWAGIASVQHPEVSETLPVIMLASLVTPTQTPTTTVMQPEAVVVQTPPPAPVQPVPLPVAAMAQVPPTPPTQTPVVEMPVETSPSAKPEAKPEPVSVIPEPVVAPAPSQAISKPQQVAAPAVTEIRQSAQPAFNPAAVARQRDEFNAYLEDLMRHLKRHKKYPSALKKAKVEGRVTLRFTLDRFGRVIASGVSDSSGNAVLDQAALSMLARANPLPSIPRSLQKDQQTLVIPIEYSLITDR